MRLFVSIALVCACFLSYKIVGVTAHNDEHADFVVAGYLPDYRIRSYLYPQVTEQKIISTTKTPLTDLMVFSLQPHPRGFFSCCLEEDHYELVEKFVNTTAPSPFSSPSIRVWVTLGGGGRTAAFPEICANSRLRQRLIGSVITLSSRYSFIGGIDLDFFQPRTMVELENYNTFLSEAITQWHHHGLKVSLTLHPGQGRFIPPDIYQLLDRIHFMTYDMIGGGSDHYHASLPKVRGVVEELFRFEVPSQKVLLGIPIYTRHLRNPSDVKTFGEIYDGIQQQSESNPNDSSMFSWEGYEWESPDRIRAKIDLAKELKMGGIFFWELGQDKTTEEHPRGILLEGAFVANDGGESPMNQEKTEL